MNYADICILVIVVGFALLGMINGLVSSVFRIASFFVSVFLAVKFYPFVADMLIKTKLYINIETAVFNKLTKGMEASTEIIDADYTGIMDKLLLPDFIKDLFVTGKSNDYVEAAGEISTQISTLIINILSVLLLFIVIRLALVLVKYILTGITKLPVLKQLDKVGGLILGALEGSLVVYVIMAILMLFNSAEFFAKIANEIESSVVAKFFYEKNLILELMVNATANFDLTTIF